MSGSRRFFSRAFTSSFRRTRLLAAVAAAGLALLHSGQSGAKKPGPSSPSLLLVTIDTWRWDYMGASGSGKVRTPTLDRLAREGVYERGAVTPCPLTTPAHATMFTGLLPLRHRVLDCTSYSLAPSVPTLAEAFLQKGYSTAAFVSGDTLKRRYGLDRGFQHYDDGGMARRGEDDFLPASRDGAEITKAALAHLRSLPASSPAFLWAHYFDLHIPYRARPRFDALYPKNSYAAQAAFVDDQVSSLLAALKRDTGRTWRVGILGDHGEGLGDHHEMGHGYALYSSTLLVPLILHPKPDSPLLHARPWGLQDLSPTLREWFGLPQVPADGANLFLGGGDERALPSLSLLPAFMFNVNASLGLRKGDWMYLRHGVEELYDLKGDISERSDLLKSPSVSETLANVRKACDSAFPIQELQGMLSPTLKATSAELEGLRGLGYISGSTPKLSELQRADIRTVLDDYNAIERSRTEAYKTKDLKPLRRQFEAFLAKYPKAAPMYRGYGKILLRLSDYDAAFKAFDRSARLNPSDPDTLLNLGTLHVKRGNYAAAKVLLEQALKLDEAEPIVHLNLGILYGDHLKQPKEALPHYRRFLELDPKSKQAATVREIVRRMEGK